MGFVLPLRQKETPRSVYDYEKDKIKTCRLLIRVVISHLCPSLTQSNIVPQSPAVSGVSGAHFSQSLFGFVA